MAILSGKADISTLHVGDEIDLKIFPEVQDAQISRGRIIYIDPKKAFFRVEFTVLTNGNVIRESYSAYGPRSTKEDKSSSASKEF